MKLAIEKERAVIKLCAEYGINHYQITVQYCGKSHLRKLYVDRLISDPLEFKKLGFLPIVLSELKENI